MALGAEQPPFSLWNNRHTVPVDVTEMVVVTWKRHLPLACLPNLTSAVARGHWLAGIGVVGTLLSSSTPSDCADTMIDSKQGCTSHIHCHIQGCHGQWAGDDGNWEMENEE